ncbi:MAG: alanine--tRNA ligase, partial [Campylobacterales bacterium]|nr:alanine--tRNA ligase [Campylobacterales bacterium]
MDIRKEFLNYFESKKHEKLDSSPLVPDDATLLFTNAGMVQFKPVFTGEVPIPENPRATTSQTCIRAGGKHNDLDNVGFTARHHTFFEMLGNFSFGDYFKEDAIAFAWEFLTEVVKLPKEKLWITIHDSDDEAGEIWKKYVPANMIIKMGDKDNFWQMGDTGPCGPCSEIHYDQGEENFSSDEDYLGGEGDRFLEIWNLVFMQYNRDESGTLNPLPKPSIDTGMGLERIIAIKEGHLSNYDSELFMPLIRKVSEFTGEKYSYDSGASYRVIADHIRSATFLLSQGTNFSNEGRGYVLRRILRRAVTHGYLLGIKDPFMYKLVDTLVAIMVEAYPYLDEKKEGVKELIQLEEKRFLDTIEDGLALFNKELEIGEKIFSGEVAFKLYDTHGFPLDLTQVLLRDKNLDVDIEKYNSCMAEQKAKAKAAWKGSGDAEAEGDFKTLLEKHGENEFVGYESLRSKAKVVALLDGNGKTVESLDSGDGMIMLDKTPFYATSGGQVGDNGEIVGKAEVTGTEKYFGLNLSKVKVTSKISLGEEVEALVAGIRSEITKHHSATHIMHSALAEILGENAVQAGSYCDENRLRFDFNYPKALTKEQISEIEFWVNKRVEEAIGRKTEEVSIEEAREKGAKALFGEKYGDKVRVVDFGSVSVELCGGTHIDNTAEIGSFFIVKESGVSAGVRRIEAVCGLSAIAYAKSFMQTVTQAQREVKNNDVLQGISKLKNQIKELKQEIIAVQSSVETPIKEEMVGDVKLIVDE